MYGIKRLIKLFKSFIRSLVELIQSHLMGLHPPKKLNYSIILSRILSIISRILSIISRILGIIIIILSMISRILSIISII